MPLEMDLHCDDHNHHLHQQHHPTPPTPPPTHKPSVEEDEDTKPRPILPLSLPNGTLKKHRQEPPQPPPLPWPRRLGHERRKNHVVYRECMKNHAAPLGGHALDGCGEFMPSPSSNPSDPASLTCAACGCHRNFHRRILHSVEVGEAGLEEEDGDKEAHSSSPPPPRRPPGFSQYCSSAPHMLMALSAGLQGGPSGSPPVAPGMASAATVGGGTPPAVLGRTLPAKRFRSKFSPEQKAGMQELCQRLGWRMQRRDDAVVEQRCREIGVSRGVFKVWMHNNKHAFVGGPSSRRGGWGGGGGGGTGVTTSCGGGSGGVCGDGEGDGEGDGDGDGGGDGCVNGENGNGSSIGHAVNSSSVSS